MAHPKYLFCYLAPRIVESWQIENIPPGQKKPAIVIDEVNALILWKRKDAVALKQLLDFIKRSCKEEHLAHVILATSEVFLVSWLESQGFEENVRDDQVLVQELGRRCG
ncbi:hypothetical protein Ndes2526B_g09582 [Nannochloris sp. 'desiccata']